MILTGAYVVLTGKLVKAQEVAGRAHFYEQAISDLARLWGEGVAVDVAVSLFPLDLKKGVPANFEFHYQELNKYYEKFRLLVFDLPDPLKETVLECALAMAKVRSDLFALNGMVIRERSAAQAAGRKPTWEGVRKEYEKASHGRGWRSWDEIVAGKAATELERLHSDVPTRVASYRQPKGVSPD